MANPSLSIKRIGDEIYEAQNQCGNHNARPNKNGTDHTLNLERLEWWNTGILG
jgi:hypothetical protein